MNSKQIVVIITDKCNDTNNKKIYIANTNKSLPDIDIKVDNNSSIGLNNIKIFKKEELICIRDYINSHDINQTKIEIICN